MRCSICNQEKPIAMCSFGKMPKDYKTNGYMRKIRWMAVTKTSKRYRMKKAYLCNGCLSKMTRNEQFEI